MDKYEAKGINENTKLCFKDFAAVCIAIFEIVAPMVAIGLVILAIVLVFVTKCWFR